MESFQRAVAPYPGSCVNRSTNQTLPIVLMKTARLLVIFVLFFNIPIVASASQTSPPHSEFPDLLTDEPNEDDSVDPSLALAISDPLEPMNRLFFKFNDELYEWVLKPTTNLYIRVLPRDLRDCFGNFFMNIATPISLLNAIMQGDLALTGNVLSRFLINSSLGVYGLVDVAADEFNIDLERADFGQTLGKWGLGEGIYFCWPLFGPSSVRDTVGLAVDSYLHPVAYLYNNRVVDLAYYTTNRVNTLSLHPDLYEDVKRYALDPYVATRQGYYEYRKALIER
ncbi:MAG: hypothetical protein ACD_75C02459G0002 [uncultured bacterium]|nr:MAG: hypothetical protein ACD_75C02459G0002 [uncultured bacterium]